MPRFSTNLFFSFLHNVTLINEFKKKKKKKRMRKEET